MLVTVCTSLNRAIPNAPAASIRHEAVSFPRSEGLYTPHAKAHEVRVGGSGGMHQSHLPCSSLHDSAPARKRPFPVQLPVLRGHISGVNR